MIYLTSIANIRGNNGDIERIIGIVNDNPTHRITEQKIIDEYNSIVGTTAPSPSGW